MLTFGSAFICSRKILADSHTRITSALNKKGKTPNKNQEWMIRIRWPVRLTYCLTVLKHFFKKKKEDKCIIISDQWTIFSFRKSNGLFAWWPNDDWIFTKCWPIRQSGSTRNNWKNIHWQSLYWHCTRHLYDSKRQCVTFGCDCMCILGLALVWTFFMRNVSFVIFILFRIAQKRNVWMIATKGNFCRISKKSEPFLVHRRINQI